MEYTDIYYPNGHEDNVQKAIAFDDGEYYLAEGLLRMDDKLILLWEGDIDCLTYKGVVFFPLSKVERFYRGEDKDALEKIILGIKRQTLN